MIDRTLVRPVLFQLDAADAHALAAEALAPIEHLGPLRSALRSLCEPHDPRIAVHALGLSFRSPLGLAGGFDKEANRPRALAALGFGFLELGTVTARAQEPNPAPNLFRLPADRALINRLGFPNEGAEAVVARFVAKGGARACGVPVGFSIGKSRVVDVDPIERAIDDYLASFRAVAPVSDSSSINVSSPNTKNLRALQGAEVARALLSAVLRREHRAKAAAAQGRARSVRRRFSVTPRRRRGGEARWLDRDQHHDSARGTSRHPAAEVEAIGAGGLSGPPVRARAREIVRRVRARLGRSVTVIGVGGIETAHDAMSFIRAGADLVQMYTGFIYGGPGTPRRIARELSELVRREGAASLSELVGVDARD